MLGYPEEEKESPFGFTNVLGGSGQLGKVWRCGLSGLGMGLCVQVNGVGRIYLYLEKCERSIISLLSSVAACLVEGLYTRSYFCSCVLRSGCFPACFTVSVAIRLGM